MLVFMMDGREVDRNTMCFRYSSLELLMKQQSVNYRAPVAEKATHSAGGHHSPREEGSSNPRLVRARDNDEPWLG